MKRNPIITLSPAHHKGREVILLQFERNEVLEKHVRQLTNSRWSQTFRSWYAEESVAARDEIFKVFNGVAWIDSSPLRKAEEIRQATAGQAGKLNGQHAQRIVLFTEWLKSRRYSDNTIGVYADALKQFFRFFNQRTPEELTAADLVDFNNRYLLANKRSASYQNQVVNAIKLFFSTMADRKMDLERVHRPKREKTLPNVLSKEEVKLILIAPRNLKHRVMLSLIYSCGLRCGELLNLKAEHIDSGRLLVIIKQAKGRKDRVVPLSEKILQMLREYYTAYRPKNWLFEGQTTGEKYDERSLQLVLKQSVAKAGIHKPVTLHWLRHSYATHLLEGGTDLRYIQEILGHSRSTTTEIYTHVSNKQLQKIVSPFDSL